MAVLIDPPRWPAHGTRFAHLVSDASLGELLCFADAQSVPVRAFDHDHYDVPERRYDDLVAAGAEPVPASVLVRRLVAGGLRVRTAERTPKADAVVPGLRAAWAALLPGRDALGRELLERWREPHRHYHDVRHLAQMLGALDLLCDGDVPRPVALAAWFHDAVHAGRAGADERASAELARAALTEVGLPTAEVSEVERLVILTIDHRTDPGDVTGAQLVDADLSVLGLIPGRYHLYSRDVRLEYPALSDELFASGRLAVLDALLSRDRLFRSPAGDRLWSRSALANLDDERDRWSRLCRDLAGRVVSVEPRASACGG